MKDFKVLFLYPSPPVGVVPSNIAVLIACLKSAGFQVGLFDASIYATSNKTQDDLRAEIGQVKASKINDFVSYKKDDVFAAFENTVKEFQPSLIAVTLVDNTVPLAVALLERVKDLAIPTIAGGITATFAWEKLFRTGVIDIACIGEGESALVELCEKMAGGEDYSNVQNMYIKQPDGTIKKNPLRPLGDINSYPYPDFSLFEDFRFYRPFHGEVVRMVPIDWDRGCPYTCTYCAAPNIISFNEREGAGKYFRKKTINRTFDEIKYLVAKHDINFLWFSSETFLAGSEKSLREFADRYIEEVNLPFWCQTRLDTFTEAKTQIIKEMGVRCVSVGLEHGNEEFRTKLLAKKISNKQIIDSFTWLAQYDIVVTVNNIIGFPDETRDLVFDTITLNREIKTIGKGNNGINSFIFMPFSGTPLRQYSIDRGYLKDLPEFPSLDPSAVFGVLGTSPLDMPSMSTEEISGLERTMSLYINLPEQYFADIRIAERDDEAGKKEYQRLIGILRELEANR